jgi:exodeoxyribonuclease VII small subunit
MPPQARGAEEEAMMANPGMEPTFEQALERLEEIVDRIEQQQIELDESLALFEEGVQLLRVAQTRLSTVEARVQQLFEGEDGFHLEDFAGDL